MENSDRIKRQAVDMAQSYLAQSDTLPGMEEFAIHCAEAAVALPAHSQSLYIVAATAEFMRIIDGAPLLPETHFQRGRVFRRSRQAGQDRLQIIAMHPWGMEAQPPASLDGGYPGPARLIPWPVLGEIILENDAPVHFPPLPADIPFPPALRDRFAQGACPLCGRPMNRSGAFRDCQHCYIAFDDENPEFTIIQAWRAYAPREYDWALAYINRAILGRMYGGD